MKDASGLRGLLPANKKQWKVFATCLFVATVFWTLMTLSDSYKNEVTIPVTYKDIPEDRYLLSELPKTIVLQVKATGYEFLSGTDLGSENTLELSLESFESVQDGSSEYYYWLPFKHIGEINKSLGRGKDIVGISTDSITIRLDKIVKERKQLSLDKNLDFDSALFLLSEPLIYPDSVWVTGAYSILNSMESYPIKIESAEIIGDNLDQDVLVKKIKGVSKVAPDSVRVFVGVDPIQQFEITADVVCMDCPDSVSFKLFPPKVQLSFHCGNKQFGQIFPGAFELAFRYADIQNGLDKLPLHLVKAPKFIQDLKITPARVEYIQDTK